MSQTNQTHLTVAALVGFLVGVVILFFLLWPVLVASLRKRTLPRILVRGLWLMFLWATVLIVSALLVRYRLVVFPHWYNTTVVSSVALVPWLLIYWRWRWAEALDRETRKDRE
jgi:hypothetical protein